MRGLVFSALVAIVSSTAAMPAHAAATTRSANFPIDGIVVPGQTIGGIALGMTQLQVEQRWGRNFSACSTCGPNLTWLYEYPGGDAVLGAAVKFSTPSGSSASSSTTAAAAATKASTAALTATKKAKVAQTEATEATATAKADATKAVSAKAAAAKAKAAGAADTVAVETAAKTAAARASTAKINATKDASVAKSAETTASAATVAAAKAATAAKAAATASTAGTVIAVFTLGSPVGWGLKGVKMGDPVTNVYNLYSNPGDINCLGYGALTVRVGNSTTSFYSANGVIYGFALTALSQSPCE
jgi:hypothetical protein